MDEPEPLKRINAKKQSKVLSLSEEAQIVHPIISFYYEEYEAKRIRNYDLAAIYILIYLTLRKPRSWSNGKLKEPIIPVHEPFPSMKVVDLNTTVQQLLDVT